MYKQANDYNEHNCDELGVRDLASVSDVSVGIRSDEDLLDLLAPDENDANIFEVGIRTATDDCVCKLPKKRCGYIQDYRSGIDEEEDEEYEEVDYEVEEQENSSNENYKPFSL